jgi:curved DNA-binding protein CbpA
MPAHDWSTTNFYDVLGAPVDATSSDITRAFRRCARESHPDTHPNDAAAAERFLRVTEAYDVLGDESMRRSYDLFRKFGPHAAGIDGALASGVRGYMYAPAPAAPAPAAEVPSRRRWVMAGVAAAAVLFGAVIIGTNGSGREEAVPTSSVTTVLAPLTTLAPDAPESFAYQFASFECGPGGWSGRFTNSDLVAFSGEISAVALQGDEVVARSRPVTPAAPVAPTQETLVQFAWNDTVPPAGSTCQIESVIQG